MSSSVFRDFDEERYSSKNLDDEEDEKLKLEQNLVILVNNKSGKVSVDERTLHSLLANETTNTSVSIVSISSPTPSMHEEMDEEDRQNMEMSQEELMQTLTEGDDEHSEQSEIVAQKKKDKIPRVGITVESYYPPEEAKHFVSEVLSLAGIENPLSIDYEFQRYVIQNDHCYTNLTIPTNKKVINKKTVLADKSKGHTLPKSGQNEELEEEKEVLSPRSQRLRKPSTRMMESHEKEKMDKEDEDDEPDVKDEQSGESESEFESEESESSIEDNDNDSDLDFDINRSNRPPKKGKKKRKIPKSKAILKNSANKISSKRHSSTTIRSNSIEESERKNRSDKKSLSIDKRNVPATQRKVVSKGKQPPSEISSSESATVIKEKEIESHTKKKDPTPSTSNASQQHQQTPGPSVSVKKDHVKKKDLHKDALLDDMSSLFSKPDKIIKKLEVKSPSVSVTKENQISNIIHYQPSRSHETTDTSNEQLDLIDSIVKKELEAQNAPQQNISNLGRYDDATENDLPDTALLESLGGESLPEDFLHTVAELAENKELQEIIDKQVLGVGIDQSSNVTTPNMQITSIVQQPSTSISSSHVLTSSTPIQLKNTKTPNISINEARKHPLKVMRSDGRVITLPPIEVPTTRGAKKRLQSDTTPDSKLDSSLDSSQLIIDSSLISNVSMTPVPVPNAAKISKSLSKDEKDFKVNRSREQSREKSTSRRSSTNRSSIDGRRDSTSQSSGSKRKRGVNPAVLAVMKNEKEDDSESGESWNSEDDPDRLWCICRQPHNNRFMICCDVCEEWFHGKCVNITKAQGNQMEAEGKEWTCPNCIKKKQEKEQPKITSFLNESTESKKSSCLVCKKPARPGSIYCSDDCITRHASNALISTKFSQSNKTERMSPSSKASTSSEGLDFDKQIQTTKILKQKEERVIVFEKSTNRCLTGANAPKAENLKQWLKEHPTFQAVTPGTAQMNAIMAKKKQLKEVAAKLQQEKETTSPSSKSPSIKIQSKLKFGESQKLTIANPSESDKHKKLPTLKSPTPKTPTTPSGHSQSKKSNSGSANKSSSSHEKKVVKKQTSMDSYKSTTGGGSKDTRDHDMIRLKSREGLQAVLEERMAEIKDEKAHKLTSEEIKEFANNVENELYQLFNKDCNQKYKVKYRSLLFNLKDRKNLTLFAKICDKSIKPYRLVRMEPQELASQELAQWRENENKHQLEMIKKSELELLACSKNIVLKTQKGEEVVESKKLDRVQLDPDMAVEDVLKVLNNSSSTSSSKQPSSKGHDDSYYVKSYTHVEESSHSKDKDKKHHHSSRSSSRHDKSHSKHKRKHSRDRSEGRHHHSSSHDSKKSRHDKKDRKHDKHSPERKDSKDKDSKDREKKKQSSFNKEIDIPTPTQEDFNLIDKILEGSQVVLTRPGMPSSQPSSSNQMPDEAKTIESDQEPSSTVNIPTPPPGTIRETSPFDVQMETKVQQQDIIWSGTINMVDVASFNIEAAPVSGDVKPIISDLPKSLDVVGRIAPQTVWDYIDKILKSPNKEIIIIRFSSPDELSYLTLYKYYDSRRRLGVIKSHSGSIKDFYILPLAAGKDLPKVLQPINGVGFVEGKNKPDLLIGVIVKINNKQGVRPKAKPPALPLLPPIITKQSLKNIDPSFSGVSDDSSSKQYSRKSKLLALGLPKTTSDEEDEPYSPGDSDENDVSSSIAITTSSTIVTVKKGIIGDEENAKLDEINREIQARKMEIAGMLNVDPDSLDEPYSPSRPVSPPKTTQQPSILPGLDKIAIPSNLSEILASIKSSGQSENLNEEYDPTTTVGGVGYYQSTVTYKASGFTETTQVSVTEHIQEQDNEQAESSSRGEKRKLGEGDLDLRILPPLVSHIATDVDEEPKNEDDYFEIPDEEGVKKARIDQSDVEPTITATGDLDLRMLNK
uniref:CSON009592 protein n=1 Tax=Culicoides sonorensis TaxID=179676 RepID=A0A336M0L1_CULSO